MLLAKAFCKPEEGLDCYVNEGLCRLHGYEDEQDPVLVKSQTGFVLTLFGCPASWQSKLQTDIALSSSVAECIAFSMAMRKLLPLWHVCAKMNLPLIAGNLVCSTAFEDNLGVMLLESHTEHLCIPMEFHRMAS